MKRMLINAAQQEELRVAIVERENRRLLDLILERQSQQTKTGNIYLGKITSIEPSLEAAFVNFGSERHGFLPLKEVAHEYLPPNSPTDEKLHINSALHLGQEIMVQIDKEERGTKGAALTSFISLAGSYLVLMPNNPRAGGISRRIEGDDREQLRENISQLQVPEGMGVIIRTAGVGKSAEELQWDLNTLLRHWEAIKAASKERAAPFLIHQESDVIIRTIRDYFREDVAEVITDSKEIYTKVRDYLRQLNPDYEHRVKLYTGNIPLFSHYQVENQIETAYLRDIRLPSGGSIVIDRTEALVSIDINSARATLGGSIEETAFNTNLEAAEEIARQLRLRDMGGLIVIDFIDMSSNRHQREVENRLRDALKLDRARVQIGRISRFGLLEMSRQRLRRSLGESTQVICPRCSGRGMIRGIESIALTVLRIIEEEANKPKTAQIQAQLPIEVATFLLNEKRNLIVDIEQRYSIEVLIIPNQHLQTPNYQIKRLTEGQVSAGGRARAASYKLMTEPEPEKISSREPSTQIDEEPAVKAMLPEAPSPTTKEAPGLIKRLWSSMFRSPKATEEETTSGLSSSGAQEKTKAPLRDSEHARKGQVANTTRTGRPYQQRRGEASSGEARSNEPRAETRTSEGRSHENRGEGRGSRSRSRNKSGRSSATGGRGQNNNRRRSSGGTNGERRPASAPVAAPRAENIPSNPPAHLPPFPEDLEDYYQKSLTPKQSPPPLKPHPEEQLAKQAEFANMENQLKAELQRSQPAAQPPVAQPPQLSNPLTEGPIISPADILSKVAEEPMIQVETRHAREEKANLSNLTTQDVSEPNKQAKEENKD